MKKTQKVNKELVPVVKLIEDLGFHRVKAKSSALKWTNGKVSIKLPSKKNTYITENTYHDIAQKLGMTYPEFITKLNNYK